MRISSIAPFVSAAALPAFAQGEVRSGMNAFATYTVKRIQKGPFYLTLLPMANLVAPPLRNHEMERSLHMSDNCGNLLRSMLQIVILLVTFKMYGEGRFMTEIIGFSMRGALVGVVLATGVVFTVSVLLCFVRIAVKQSSCAGIFDFAASKILLVIFLGVVLSEAWISFDEYRFSRKTSYSGIMKEHRPRSFPFKGYDLHYENARGMWTTD